MGGEAGRNVLALPDFRRLWLVGLTISVARWLEMLVVGAGGPIRQFWRARRLFLRRMAPAEGLWRGSVTNASIRGARLMCHVDGETFEASGELNVVLQPGALMVAGASG